DVPALDVLSEILSDGESSRLHQSLVYEKQIALEVSTSFRSRIEPTLFECYVEMRPGKSAAEGEAAVDSVVAKLEREGPSERELEKARNLLEAGFIRGLKTNNGTGEQPGFDEPLDGGYPAL